MPERQGQYTNDQAWSEMEQMQKAIEIGEVHNYQEASEYVARDLETAEDNFKAIEDMVRPLERIIEQAREMIEKGEINLLVGDDTRGRIPTLILRDVLKSLYEKQGHETPSTVFLASGRLSAEQETTARNAIQNIVTQNANKKRPTKALIVTELIYSGENVSHIIDTLAAEGVPSEIACLFLDVGDYKRRQQDKIGGESVTSDGRPVIDILAEQQLLEMERKLATKILWGGVRRDESWKYSRLSGLEKVQGQAFAKVREREYEGETDVRETIQKSRTAAAVAVEQILQHIESH